jgi:ribonuclease P protein component
MPFFSRKYRLTSRSDFQAVFAKPSKTAFKYLLALSTPNSLSHARIGIIVSKNRLRRAVDRNQFRRIIRESFRQRESTLKGLDIIVLLRSEWSPLCKKTLRNDTEQLWLKLKTSPSIKNPASLPPV